MQPLNHRRRATAPPPPTPRAPDASELMPLWVSDVYAESPAELRARLLECLLKPVGVLGLVAVAGGAFAALRQRTGWQRLNVTLDDTLSYTSDQVLELATYLQQSTPDVFSHVADLLVGSPTALTGLSAVLLLHALRRRNGPVSPPAGG